MLVNKLFANYERYVTNFAIVCDHFCDCRTCDLFHEQLATSQMWFAIIARATAVCDLS